MSMDRRSEPHQPVGDPIDDREPDGRHRDVVPLPPDRPTPPLRLADRIGAWISWFGPVRLVGTAACMVVVAAAAYWLVHTPAPPPETGLPVSTVVSVPSLTLPPPEPDPSGDDATDTSADDPRIVVHVAGEVARPGVYVLGENPRVHDAIDLAGGPTTAADLDALNLAARLLDGQRLYVPSAGEVDPGGLVAPVPVGMPNAAPDAAGPPAPIDLNRATAADLDALPGVGPATAQAIVDDRARNGPFAQVDDLDRVPGIGPAKLAALRDLVVV
jgi:competence protein ComEA